MADNVATDRVRKVWDRQANSWHAQRDRMHAATRPVHEWLVEHLGPLVASLSDAARTDLRTAIDGRLAAFRRADGIVLPSRCWCGLAVR